jgi:nucleotide-binding universal stress UspA family protein
LGPAVDEERKEYTMVERVIVATDGGNASLAAIDWVIDYAKNTAIDVEVVTVEETGQMLFGADPRAYRNTYLAHLLEGERRLTNHHGIFSVTRTLMAGVPSQELADASQNADLVVVGSNPVNPGSARLRATLALRLAPLSNCPLIVVPASWNCRLGAIVVGIEDDGSSSSAIDFAAHEAGISARDLVAVHSWLPAPPFTAVGRKRESQFPTLKLLHQQFLDAAVARAQRVAPRVRVTGILQFGPASDALARAAREASLLVVGTHRYGIVVDAVRGATSQKAVVSAICPVAVVSSDRILLEPPRGLVS